MLSCNQFLPISCDVTSYNKERNISVQKTWYEINSRGLRFIFLFVFLAFKSGIRLKEEEEAARFLSLE